MVSKVALCDKCKRLHYTDADCPNHALTPQEAIAYARAKGYPEPELREESGGWEASCAARGVDPVTELAPRQVFSPAACQGSAHVYGGYCIICETFVTNADPPGYKAKVQAISDELRRQASNFDARGSSKPTINPKDQCGVLKAPLSYVSWPVVYGMALGMCEGGYKYGGYNYRVAGVQASIYFDATMRHLTAWWEGQDFDPDSKAKLHHIDKAMASLHVLRDSILQGNVVDDRPPRTPSGVTAGWLQGMNTMVEVLNQQYPNPVPRWTQKRIDEQR